MACTCKPFYCILPNGITTSFVGSRLIFYRMAFPTNWFRATTTPSTSDQLPWLGTPRNVSPCHAVDCSKSNTLSVLITHFRVMVRLCSIYHQPDELEIAKSQCVAAEMSKKLNATLVFGFNPTTTNYLLPGFSLERLPILPRELGNWSDSNALCLPSDLPPFSDSLSFRFFL
jgi:hypothetical protein